MDRERESMDKKFKSGFCAIIGMPNVGKSTLLNSIAGQKIAIISDKPQTTRNKILAIYSTDTEQIMFTDTPGIHNPHNKLGEYMVRMANESMRFFIKFSPFKYFVIFHEKFYIHPRPKIGVPNPFFHARKIIANTTRRV